MDFLDKLGIDWKLFLAQLINFVVLLFILYRFLYKPVIKMLDKRKKEIEDNAKKTEILEAKMVRADLDVKEQLKKAEKDAQQIIHEAREVAKRTKEDTLEEVNKEMRRLKEEAKNQIERERDEALRLVLKESESLVKQSVTKVLEAIADGEISKSLEKKALDAISSLKK